MEDIVTYALLNKTVNFWSVVAVLISGVFTIVLFYQHDKEIEKLEDRLSNLESKFIADESTIDQPQDETV
jgi:helix-turn-helix protein